MDKKLRIFIDSNIWFSAFYGKGKAFQFLEGIRDRHEIVISELVIQEIIVNIRKKIPHKLLNANKFLITYPLTIIKNPSKEELKQKQGLAEKKDLPILASAINYHCQFFLTGNLKDFEISKIRKLYDLKIINLSQVPDRLVRIF